MNISLTEKVKVVFKFSFQEKDKFLIPVLLVAGSSIAQVVNKGDIAVKGNTIFSIHGDYQNTHGSQLLNDGDIYVFQNWDNDGQTGYNINSNSSTFFIGKNEQIIEGDQASNFANAVFDNTSTVVPFHLATEIRINSKAIFKNGIIEAKEYGGIVIFNEKALPELAGDKSFVKGKVKKRGDSNFEFPIGDDVFYRPALQGDSTHSVVTVEYFKKNSDLLHSHNNREEVIENIDDAEYWQVDQNSGNDKIVLSLTLDDDTTPNSFLNLDSNHMLAIVRWDENSRKWVSEGGVVSDPSVNADHQRIITSKVSGLGIFTIAVIKKTDHSENEDLIVFNGISPNGDGLNDNFHIKGIDNYPENKVEIYNRWGVLVYEADSYNESDKMFRGYSEGRVTIDKSSTLPSGTYFYILKYKKGEKVIDKSGYLYISAK